MSDILGNIERNHALDAFFDRWTPLFIRMNLLIVDAVMGDEGAEQQLSHILDYLEKELPDD